MRPLSRMRERVGVRGATNRARWRRAAPGSGRCAGHLLPHSGKGSAAVVHALSERGYSLSLRSSARITPRSSARPFRRPM